MEVGGPLYEIDTDAEATVAAASGSTKETTPTASVDAPVAATAPVTASPPASATETPSSDSGHRTPSIHFLGKEGWTARLAGTDPSAAVAVPSVMVSTPAAVAVDDTNIRGKSVTITGPLPPMYGRLAFTEAEMEALITGGASIAPVVKKASSGAKFG